MVNISPFSHLSLSIAEANFGFGLRSKSQSKSAGVKELEDFVADVGELRLDPGQKVLQKWVAIRVVPPK